MKNIVLILVMAAFTLNAYAVSAMTLCVCEEMAQVEMSGEEMPCHEMAKADTGAEQTDDQIDQDQNKSTKCENCCGNCKIPTQASLFSNKSSTDFFSKTMEHTSYNDIHDSMYLYGIDYPPKRNS